MITGTIGLLLAAACGGNDGDPAAVIESYVSAYNARDVSAVMGHFNGDSVIVGHPVLGDVSGIEAIRSLHITEIAAADPDTPLSISKLRVEGDTVTWNDRWTSIDGDELCADGHRAAVAEGRIQTWTWPGTLLSCP